MVRRSNNHQRIGGFISQLQALTDIILREALAGFHCFAAGRAGLATLNHSLPRLPFDPDTHRSAFRQSLNAASRRFQPQAATAAAAVAYPAVLIQMPIHVQSFAHPQFFRLAK